MELRNLQKLAGFSIILGSALFILWAVFWTTLLPIQERARDFSLLVSSPNWLWINALALPGVILMVFGFTGVYSKIFQVAGVLGLLGYLFIVTAYILQACQLTWEIFLYPTIAENSQAVDLFRKNLLLNNSLGLAFRIIFDASILVGVVLFSITLLRSKLFDNLAGILILVGAITYGVGPMIHIYVALCGVFLLSGGCLILGWNLVHGKPSKTGN